jgi:hypothetical protein
MAGLSLYHGCNHLMVPDTIAPKYKKIDLLILNEWLLTELSEENVLCVLEII